MVIFADGNEGEGNPQRLTKTRARGRENREIVRGFQSFSFGTYKREKRSTTRR